MTDTVTATKGASSPRDIVPKAEQARRTRALIVQTGIRCLATYGFATTTMLLIAREAGISRGPLHYHFADRNDLMAAIAEALPRGVSTALRERLSAPRTLDERLQTLVDVALEEHLGPHHFAAMELLLAARNDPDLLAAIQPHFLASEIAVDDWWTEYFALLRWPAARLVAFRHVTVACLRGLALDHLLQGDAAAHGEALALFREMFLMVGRAPVSDSAPDA
jgi:AcrR family transcriptional regulator